MTEEPGNEPDLEGVTDAAVLALLRQLYRQLATEREWTTEDMIRKGRIRDFVDWCRKNQLPQSQRRELLEAGFEPAAVAYVSAVLAQDDFTVAAVLLPLWEDIALVGRPPVSPQPVMTRVQVAIFFANGQQLVATTPAVLISDEPYTDGRLLMVLRNQCETTLDSLKEKGFAAALKEHGSPPNPEMVEKMREAIRRRQAELGSDCD